MTEYCPPGSRHHTSWVKVKNLIIVSSGVWWRKAIYVAMWRTGSGCVQGDMLVLVHSFMQQVFIKQHDRVGRTLCQVSSFATYKLGDVHWQIWAWLFFPEICSVDLMERVHVKAPVHVRLGLGNVDECGCS